MIDLHSHILPSVDDGSKNPQMSREMLSAMHRQGIKTVVATPHFYASKDKPEDFLHRRAAAFAQLELDTEETPRILLGAEVAYFDAMSGSQVLESLQIGDTGLLLVEMPFDAWTQRIIEEILQISVRTGLTPVLAHVDRYRQSNQLPKYCDELLRQGVLFQCNADAFLPLWRRHWALQMLQQGKIHFLGSDAHNLTDRAPNLDQAAEVITRKLGKEILEEMTAFSKELLKL